MSKPLCTPVSGLVQVQDALVFPTDGKGFNEITSVLEEWLAGCGVSNGLLTLFISHSSASLTIQENADPDVRLDLLDALAGVAPEDRVYRHSSEGADDMPSHIKAMLTDTSVAIPVREGVLQLGAWQGVFLIEHRNGTHHRRIHLHLIGEPAAASS